jgi:tetratricopeptide (TPR) repeat protein
VSRFSPSRFLDKLRSRKRDQEASRELEELEERAQTASLSFRPHYLVRAAQIAGNMDRHEHALALYGRAIDGYIEAGRSRAAEALCRKVVADYPSVVRARRTLALLALGRGDFQDAEKLMARYAEVARENGDLDVLRVSLRTMAAVGEAGPVLDQAARELRAMGDDRGAELVLRHRATHNDMADTASGRWSHAVQAALLGPKELRNGPWASKT